MAGHDRYTHHSRPIGLVLILGLMAACSSDDGGGPVIDPPVAGACADSCIGVVHDGGGATLLHPADLVYLGAFRLPGGDVRPQTFAYGGNAMTYWPDGDPDGDDDGFPGSLFITGHDRMPYGDLPDGDQLAEVDIPQPAIGGDVNALPQAGFRQGFHDISGGLFDGLDEIPRIGLALLDLPQTGPRLHIAWGQHFQEDPHPSHAMISTDLADPQPAGAWYVGDAPLYCVNGYMFEIPPDWAQAHAGGRRIATGRYRDGGWSGKGPALFAYLPVDAVGATPAAGVRIPATTLMRFEDSQANDDPAHGSLDFYQHADEWEGGAWLSTVDGRSAVILAGTKGVGAKYWYGFVSAETADEPCVEVSLVDQFVTCRCSCGEPCPEGDYDGCATHSDARGWWSSRFSAQIIFFDPAEFAAVAAGTGEPASPRPYAVYDLDPFLFDNPAGTDSDALGTGARRRYRLGDVAYDRARGLVYVLELFADQAKPVVHVFRVE